MLSGMRWSSSLLTLSRGSSAVLSTWLVLVVVMVVTLFLAVRPQVALDSLIIGEQREITVIHVIRANFFLH